MVSEISPKSVRMMGREHWDERSNIVGRPARDTILWTIVMPIELTEPQQRALDSEPGIPEVLDPRNRARYLLIPADQLEAVREVLDDERRQQAIRQVGLKNAGHRMGAEP